MATVQKTKKEIPTKRNGWYYIPYPDPQPKPRLAVTEILGNSIDKGALRYWTGLMAARIALEDPTLNEKAVMAKVGSISGEAAKRGRTVHSLTEASDVQGTLIKTESLPEDYRGYLEAFNKFKLEYKPELIFNEQIVFNDKYNYAGTLDRIYKIGGKQVLCDIKTSKDFYKDMGIQLSAYKNAEYIYIQQEKKILPFVDIDQMIILLLGQDGTYALREMKDCFPIFLACYELYKFLHEDKMKEVK